MPLSVIPADALPRRQPFLCSLDSKHLAKVPGGDERQAPNFDRRKVAPLGRFIAAGTAHLEANPPNIRHRSCRLCERHDDWTARDWIQDQDCYRIGIVRAMMNLIEAMPNPSPQEKELLLVYLKTRMTNSLIQSGHLKVDFHDGRGPVGNEFLGPTDEERKAAEDAAPATVSDPHPVTEEEYDRLVVEMEENSRRTAEEASKRAHTADAATEAAVKKVAKAIRGRQAGAGKRQKGAA